jgi:hypothetical protein
LDLHNILQSIRNLNLTNDERVIVVDHNGSAIVDFSQSSATNGNASLSSSKLKDFSYLKSTKALIQGNAGSLIETLNGTKKLMVYQPVQIGNRFWGVILIEPLSKSSSFADIRNRVT